MSAADVTGVRTRSSSSYRIGACADDVERTGVPESSGGARKAFGSVRVLRGEVATKRDGEVGEESITDTEDAAREEAAGQPRLYGEVDEGVVGGRTSDEKREGARETAPLAVHSLHGDRQRQLARLPHRREHPLYERHLRAEDDQHDPAAMSGRVQPGARIARSAQERRHVLRRPLADARCYDDSRSFRLPFSADDELRKRSDDVHLVNGRLVRVPHRSSRRRRVDEEELEFDAHVRFDRLEREAGRAIVV